MVDVEEDEEATDGERDVDDAEPGYLYSNEGGGGNGPTGEGRVKLGGSPSDRFRPSPPPLFPFTSSEHVNKESLRCLGHSRSSLALDALSLAAFATLAGESPSITDLSIITYSLVPDKSPFPVTTNRSDTVTFAGPTNRFEPLERSCLWLGVSKPTADGRVGLVPEDLAREGPGSLVITLWLLSRVGRWGMDRRLLSCAIEGEGVNDGEVSGSRYLS